MYEHKVLTTSQLTDLHFDSQRVTERRLLKLAKGRLVRIAYSPRLGHLVALNTFFTRLNHRCRQSQDLRVTHWSEDRVRRRWGQIVLPDALGQLEGAGLGNRIIDYEEVTASAHLSRLLPFWFPGSGASDSRDGLATDFRAR